MKTHLILTLFCLTTFSAIKAQTRSWTIDSRAISKVYSPDFQRSRFYISNTHSSLIAPVSLTYQTRKLPFFCMMEEKSRNKFNFFLKIRAGNDESYLKLIKSSEK